MNELIILSVLVLIVVYAFIRHYVNSAQNKLITKRKIKKTKKEMT